MMFIAFRFLIFMKKIIFFFALICVSSVCAGFERENFSEDQIKQKALVDRLRLPQVKAIEKWTVKVKNVVPRTFAPSLVRLSDGRYRMYSNAFGFTGIDSYISEDGINFTKEAGLRLSGTGKNGDPHCSISHPWVIPVSQGYRMYYQANAVCDWQGDAMAKGEPEFKIMSAFSKNGLDFTHDSGFRVDTVNGLVQVAHGRILTLKDGTLRMYFSANTRPRSPSHIMGASSRNGLTWKVDDQATIMTAHDPTVIRQGEKIIMYTAYDMFNTLKLESNDGYHFTPVAWMEFQDEMGTAIQRVDDIDVIVGPNGDVRIYGSWKGSHGVGVFEKTP